MNFRFIGRGIVLLVLGLTFASAPGIARDAGNEQNQVFKVRTELVEVRAVVTDQKGRLVENLKQEDFDLLENNRSQEISHFSVLQVEAPQDKAQSSQLQKPTAGSLRDRLSAPPARSIILFVDNLHLQFEHLNWVKQNLRKIVNEQMTDQDMIAIVTSDGALGIAQQFTRDRQVLRYAIERIQIGPNAWETELFTATLAGRIMRGDPKAMEEGKAIIRLEEGIDDKFGAYTRARANRILFGLSYFRETMLLTLKTLIEQLAGMPGQRMIALLSGGLTQNGRDGWPKYDEARSVINRAARSGVVIYSIDGRGLMAGRPDPEKLDILSALARDTGGEFYMNENNISGLVGRAFESNRFYYVLGYYLQPGKEDRKFNSIKVRIRNHPEYKIRTIKGFSPSEIAKELAEEEEKTPQQQMIRSINKALPLTALKVSAQMDFVEPSKDGALVTLTVRFDGDKLQYRQKDRGHAFEVEIVSALYDAGGKQVEAVSTNVQGTLTPERLAQSQANGYVFTKQLTLKPGVYQARIGVREIESGRMGTTSAWVEVPDLERSKLALSSLMLLDPLHTESPNGNDLKQVKLIQGIRIYPRNEFCGYVFRVFRNPATSIGTDLTLKTDLLKDGKPIKPNPWQPLVEEKKDKDDKGNIYVGGKVNFSGLEPGVYELSISINDARTKKTAQRTAVFGIE
jgi:VWFA-related protein